MATRRISLEQDFYNKSINDLFYSYLLCLATYHPVEERLYLSEANYTKNRKDIRYICRWADNKTLKRNRDKLIELGLVQESKIKVNGEEVECLTFPFDKNGKYQVIDKDMLEYLVNTRGAHAIQIYTYLLNKYLWKTKSNEVYEFSAVEIAKAMGYSDKSVMIIKHINILLDSFNREGVISIERGYQECINPTTGEVIPKPVIYLDNVREKTFK